MSGVEWRYAPGRRAAVKHALTHASAAAAVCGMTTIPASDWLGTGSQREYERVEELRPCRRCLALLGRTAKEVSAVDDRVSVTSTGRRTAVTTTTTPARRPSSSDRADWRRFRANPLSARRAPRGASARATCRRSVPRRSQMAGESLCRRWVGPVWKLGGETCVCKLRADHSDGQFGADHECTCGAWFIDADAHPPAVPSSKEPADQ